MSIQTATSVNTYETIAGAISIPVDDTTTSYGTPWSSGRTANELNTKVDKTNTVGPYSYSITTANKVTITSTNTTQNATIEFDLDPSIATASLIVTGGNAVLTANEISINGEVTINGDKAVSLPDYTSLTNQTANATISAKGFVILLGTGDQINNVTLPSNILFPVIVGDTVESVNWIWFKER